MIEVEMSKDLRDITPKLIGPFTKRQIISVCIGIGCALPVFFITGMFTDSILIKLVVSIIFMIPAVACGWIDAYGMHLEQFIIFVIKDRTKNPPKRIKYTKNIYEEMLEQLE